MSDARSFQQARQALAASRGRALLTTLGVLVGSAAWVGTMGVTSALRQRLGDPIGVLDVDEIRVRRFAALDGADAAATTRPQLSMRDYASVRRLPEIDRATLRTLRARDVRSPEVFGAGIAVEATGHAALAFGGRRIARGRFFSAREVSTQQACAVLGASVAAELFPGSDALGQSLWLDRRAYRVIGVLQAHGGLWGRVVDQRILIPCSASGAQASPDALQGLEFLLKRDPDSRTRQVVDEVRSALRNARNLSHEDADNFAIESGAALHARGRHVRRRFDAALGAVAALTLLVAAVGIVNVQLVALDERTREIGLRRAVGARRRDIARQFLVESMLVSGGGGVAGAATANILCALLDDLTSLPITADATSVLIGVALSVSVGVVAGVWPASRASRLEPVRAMREV